MNNIPRRSFLKRTAALGVAAGLMFLHVSPDGSTDGSTYPDDTAIVYKRPYHQHWMVVDHVLWYGHDILLNPDQRANYIESKLRGGYDVLDNGRVIRSNQRQRVGRRQA